MKHLFLARLVGMIWCIGLMPHDGVGQAWRWATAPGNDGNSNSGISAMLLDTDGTTVVAGFISGTVTLGNFTLRATGRTDIFVARLNQNGTWVQATRVGGSQESSASALALAPDSTLVVAGVFSSPSISFGSIALANADNSGTSSDVFVARMTRAGVWTQAVRAGGAATETVGTLAIDNHANVVVAGSFIGSTASFGATVLTNDNSGTNGFPTEDIFVARLSRSGNWLQAVRAGGMSFEYPTALAVTPDGTVVVAGNFFSQTVRFGPFQLVNAGIEADVFVARLNPNGDWITALRTGGPNYDSANGIALTADGTIIVAGNFDGIATTIGTTSLLNADNTGTYFDAFVARLTPTGIWTQVVRAGGITSDGATRVAVSSDGAITVAGYFSGKAATFGTTTLTSTGGNDIFVARLSPAGNWAQVRQAGGPGDDVVHALCQPDSTSLAIAGRIGWPIARFGALTIANNNVYFPNAFVAHYGGSPTPFFPVDFVIPNVLTPNGDGQNDIFRFQNSPVAIWNLCIYSRWGQSIYENPHYQQDWDAANVPAGIYYYYLQRNDGGLPLKGWLEIIRQ